jgi:hypothetical protein
MYTLRSSAFRRAHAQSGEWKRRLELSRDTGLVAAVLLSPSSTPRRRVLLDVQAWRRWWWSGVAPGYCFWVSPCRVWCVFQANSFTLRGMGFSCRRNSTDEPTCSGAEHVSYIFPQQPPHGPRIARLAKCAFALVLRECRIAGRGDLFAPPLIYRTPAPGYRMFICCLGYWYFSWLTPAYPACIARLTRRLNPR